MAKDFVLMTAAFLVRFAGLLLFCGGMAATAQLPTRTAAPPSAAAPQRPAQLQVAGQSGQAQSATAQAAKEGYRIAADDVIEVDVLGQPDFKSRVRVRSDGTIQLPLIGTQQVAEETPITLATKVAGQLRSGGFFTNPIVNVEVVSFASRYVVVLGGVATPGLQPVDRAYRVSEIIARAGGLREVAADYVVVSRSGQPEQRLPFDSLARGSDDSDPFVQPGDKIFVPDAEIFYIYGQVNAPGVYPVKDQMTLRQALARAGGLTASGSAKRVKVFNRGKEQKYTLEQLIRSEDVIVVGERLF